MATLMTLRRKLAVEASALRIASLRGGGMPSGNPAWRPASATLAGRPSRRPRWTMRTSSSIASSIRSVSQCSYRIMRAVTSSGERRQFSVEKAHSVTVWMPMSRQNRARLRAISKPVGWPSMAGTPCWLAHRRFPSGITARCKGMVAPARRSWASFVTELFIAGLISSPPASFERGHPIDNQSRQALEGVPCGTLGGAFEHRQRTPHVLLGKRQRVLERSALEHSGPDGLDVGVGAADACLDAGVRFERIDDRKRVHAVAQVRARGLAELLLAGCEVEEVVGQLEREAERGTELPQCLDVLGRAAGERSSEPRGRLDQRGRLLADRGEVLLGRPPDVVGALELADLTLDNLR